MTADSLPALNAVLNGTATVLLVLGWRAVRRGDPRMHRRFMLAALALSTVFLASYLTYHSVRVSETGQGHTVFPHTGWIRGVYYTILLTHIPLAALVVPACLVAVYQAVRGRYDRHKRITRWLWPVWLYVSVTGVFIYLLLYHL